MTFLLRDDFTTAEAAPLASPRTALPGPGTWTITDTGNKASISGGALVWTSGTGVYDPILQSAAFARAAGLALVLKANVAAGRNRVGWRPSVGGTDIYGMEFDATARLTGGGVDIFSTWTPSFSTTYSVAQILRSGANGCFFAVKGGIYTDWTLIWVADTGTAANPVAFLSGITTASSLSHDTARILQLAAPYDSDFGLASQRTASPLADATITSEANALIEFTWTAATGETLELSVRRTDDNNRWIVRGDQAGSTVKLIEVNAGVETERASAAQTWTNGTSYRLFVVQDGDTIKGYVANVLKWTYSSASFNNTATGVKTNKAGTDLVAYPRQLSGTAASLLDSAIA